MTAVIGPPEVKTSAARCEGSAAAIASTAATVRARNAGQGTS